jgi:hypothetical protein
MKTKVARQEAAGVIVVPGGRWPLKRAAQKD